MLPEPTQLHRAHVSEWWGPRVGGGRPRAVTVLAVWVGFSPEVSGDASWHPCPNTPRMASVSSGRGGPP